jgi:hypothetical protein
MARISGLSRPTVYTGVHELDDPPDPHGRVRRPGDGPKRLTKRQPSLLSALDALVDPDTRGDPESPLRWTSKSTRELADALGAQGFQVSDDTVGRLLRQQRYTLQRTQKTKEGTQHPLPRLPARQGPLHHLRRPGRPRGEPRRSASTSVARSSAPTATALTADCGRPCNVHSPAGVLHYGDPRVPTGPGRHRGSSTCCCPRP